MMAAAPRGAVLALLAASLLPGVARGIRVGRRIDRHAAAAAETSETSVWAFDLARGVVPALAGADCADPPRGLPRICCLSTAGGKYKPTRGIRGKKGEKTHDTDVNPEYANTCDCNPGWTGKQCTCHTSYLARPCHSCMVHLPAANLWPTDEKSDEDLYGMCKSCVTTCMEGLRKGDCKDQVDEVLERHFPGHSAVEDEICTNGHLKEKLFEPQYPLKVKRALYRKPGVSATGDDVRSLDYKWNVPGVGTYLDPSDRASAKAKAGKAP